MTGNKTWTTPGVYVSEITGIPTAIQGVATAVPIFIGYTARGAALAPTPIASLADYERTFGGADGTLCEIVPTAAGAVPDIASPPGGAYTLAVRVRHNLHPSIRLFYENGGGDAYVVSAGDYATAVSLDALTQGLAAAGNIAGPTLIVVPEAILLPADPPQSGKVIPTSMDFQALIRAMLAQAGAQRDRFAILDVYGAGAVGQRGTKADQAALDACAAAFRTAAGDAKLSFGAAYFPLLNSTIVADVDYTCFAPSLSELTAILRSQAAMLYPDGTAQYAEVMALIDSIPKTLPTASLPATPAAIATLNGALTAALPLLQRMQSIVAAKLGVLPPGAALAGVMTANDAARGVWSGAANIALNAVVSPSVVLDDDQQSPLNVPTDGRAINIIRQFAGRGPTVWGARTLDGNSNDYRYIQVRRTVVYVETSIKAGLEPFVFAANDAATWARATEMIAAFLTGLWRQGGLMGTTPSDAFSVRCGLDHTMTAQDILEGAMIVQVLLALTHPAEFVVLIFKQKMEGV
ncbi:MAG: phage tail sheath C-terminal domain-containing protein [Rhizomicrobium sp.]